MSINIFCWSLIYVVAGYFMLYIWDHHYLHLCVHTHTDTVFSLLA